MLGPDFKIRAIAQHESINVRDFRPPPEFEVGEVLIPLVTLNDGAILNYVKTQSPWLIEITFPTNLDAAVFCSVLRGSNLRAAYYRSSIKEKVRYFLINCEFTSDTTEYAVSCWIRDVLPVVVAAVMVKFSFFLGVSVNNLYTVGSDGKALAHSKIASVHIQGTEADPVARDLLESGTSIAPLLSISSSNAEFWKALYHFGNACHEDSFKGWSNLYKAHEVVRHATRTQMHIRGGLAKALGCSATELTRFTRTANNPDSIGFSARHGVVREPPPENPMSFREATAFIASLIGRWYTQISLGASSEEPDESKQNTHR